MKVDNVVNLKPKDGFDFKPSLIRWSWRLMKITFTLELKTIDCAYPLELKITYTLELDANKDRIHDGRMKIIYTLELKTKDCCNPAGVEGS